MRQNCGRARIVRVWQNITQTPTRLLRKEKNEPRKNRMIRGALVRVGFHFENLLHTISLRSMQTNFVRTHERRFIPFNHNDYMATVQTIGRCENAAAHTSCWPAAQELLRCVNQLFVYIYREVISYLHALISNWYLRSWN